MGSLTDGVVTLRDWELADAECRALASCGCGRVRTTSPRGRVAERAGYERAPEHDETKTVKGAQWRTAAYRLLPETARAESLPGPSGGGLQP